MITRIAARWLAARGDRGSWAEFWTRVYKGGKKRVPNPNPETKDRYPEVAASTAMRSWDFRDQVSDEYWKWLGHRGKGLTEEAHRRKRIKVTFAHPESVEELLKIAKKLKMTPSKVMSNLLKASGAEELQTLGHQVRVSLIADYDPMKMTCHISAGPVQNMSRTIDFQRKEVQNEYLFLRENAPAGLGTRILASQVQGAKKLGMKRLTCFAGGSRINPNMVGYYVWPLLGYQRTFKKKELREEFEYRLRLAQNEARDMRGKKKQEMEQMISALEKFMKERLRGEGSISIQEFMKTPEGRELWKFFGFEGDMTFDLSSGSDSLEIFQKYLRKKGIRKKLGARTPAQKGVPIEQILLEDEELLAEVWSAPS